MPAIKKFRLELSGKGVEAILNSEEMAAELKRRGSAFRDRLEGEWSLDEGRTDRTTLFVRPADKTAREFAIENPGLVVAALGGGSG